MFRRIVTEHWQASLALALFILSVLGTLLAYLHTLHLPRDQADKRAAMALDDESPGVRGTATDPIPPPSP